MPVANKYWGGAQTWLSCMGCFAWCSSAAVGQAQAPEHAQHVQTAQTSATSKDAGTPSAAPKGGAGQGQHGQQPGKRSKSKAPAAQSGTPTGSSPAKDTKSTADAATPPAAAAAPVKPAAPPSKPPCSLTDPEQPRGGRLELVAEHFGSVPVVRISGKPARMLERRETRVSVQIPADSDGGPITVLQDGHSLECGTLVIIGKNR